MVSSIEYQTKRTLSNHRHAAPSAPWPWIDISKDAPSSDTTTKQHECPHKPLECIGCWQEYPQSHFPNWTGTQVEASGLLRERTSGQTTHRIRYVDVDDKAKFTKPPEEVVRTDEEEFWKIMQAGKRAENIRLRALFVDNPSLSVLKMIGYKYEVEPFFWTSSINWIPARYQENAAPNKGDHITIILAFPHAIKHDEEQSMCAFPHALSHDEEESIRFGLMLQKHGSNSGSFKESKIDTQAPLRTLDHRLVLDLLGIHVIRDAQTSTIISYRPPSEDSVTSASSLQSRVYLAGQSVYWQKIFQSSKDPTFVLLTILWYALFAWDQSLEILWLHIARLEMNIIKTNKDSNNNNTVFTNELYRVRAYLLHYASLLDDFQKSVKFVLETKNPAMDAPEHADQRVNSEILLKRECKILLGQIDRLCQSREHWDNRLTNMMHLAYASVNIEDSRYMKSLTEATVRDSAAMKQIAYLTMVFLPASFMASAFGMNIKEIFPDIPNNPPQVNATLAQYFAVALPLTFATVWVVVALQGNWKAPDGKDATMLTRFTWPMLIVQSIWHWARHSRNGPTETTPVA